MFPLTKSYFYISFFLTASAWWLKHQYPREHSVFYRKQSKNSITQQPGDWCVQTQSNTERIMMEHVKWSPKNWSSLKHPLHNRGISSRSLLHTLLASCFTAYFFCYGWNQYRVSSKFCLWLILRVIRAWDG